MAVPRKRILKCGRGGYIKGCKHFSSLQDYTSETIAVENIETLADVFGKVCTQHSIRFDGNKGHRILCLVSASIPSFEEVEEESPIVDQSAWNMSVLISTLFSFYVERVIYVDFYWTRDDDLYATLSSLKPIKVNSHPPPMGCDFVDVPVSKIRKALREGGGDTLPSSLRECAPLVRVEESEMGWGVMVDLYEPGICIGWGKSVVNVREGEKTLVYTNVCTKKYFKSRGSIPHPPQLSFSHTSLFVRVCYVDTNVTTTDIRGDDVLPDLLASSRSRFEPYDPTTKFFDTTEILLDASPTDVIYLDIYAMDLPTPKKLYVVDATTGSGIVFKNTPPLLRVHEVVSHFDVSEGSHDSERFCFRILKSDGMTMTSADEYVANLVEDTPSGDGDVPDIVLVFYVKEYGVLVRNVSKFKVYAFPQES